MQTKSPKKTKGKKEKKRTRKNKMKRNRKKKGTGTGTGKERKGKEQTLYINTLFIQLISVRNTLKKSYITALMYYFLT